MKSLFEYTIYKLYVWNEWNCKVAQRLGIAWKVDIAFDAIWGLTIIQAFFAIAGINVIIAIFDLNELVKFLVYIWGGILLIIYLYNYIYYQRSKRYKAILQNYSKKRTSNIPLFILLIGGFLLFILSNIWVL